MQDHIVSCLHPKRVWNKYINQYVTVPCGRCEACLESKASRLTSRLKFERLSWRYCVFLTLTYDNEHLPVLQLYGSHLIDTSPSRVHPILGTKVVDINESYHKLGCSKDEINKSDLFIKLASQNFGGLPYLSTVDVQRFMKRLRINLVRGFNRSKDNYTHEKNLPSIRFFACGEYGESSFRPHYHILLFSNSEYFAAHVESFARSCWSNGYLHCAFVQNDCSSYVAEYCTCSQDCPAIYKATEIRPFSLYSKHPALGTLVYNSDALKSQFLSCSVTQSFAATSLGQPLNVSIWRTFQDSLYPKLPYTDTLSPAHRSKLLRICCSTDFKSCEYPFNHFRSLVECSKLDYIKSYLDFIRSKPDGDYFNSLYKWFSCSMRVSLQSDIFNITPETYCKCIDKFYQSKDYSLLVKHFAFQESYSKEHDICELLGLDWYFLQSVKDVRKGDLDVTEVLYFKSFENLDFDKFFSDDPTERSQYQALFDLKSSYEYSTFAEDAVARYNNNKKTKKKNDYLYIKSVSDIDSSVKEYYDMCLNIF